MIRQPQECNKLPIPIKLLYVTALIACILVIIEAAMGITGVGISDALGLISTTISIVLAVISIAYSYEASKKTNDNLEAICDQNDSLIRRINQELSKDNFNDQNIQNVRDQDFLNT